MEGLKPIEPDAISIEGQEAFNLIYIFLLDRSGSMSGKKMQMAKDALKLFIQSIPKGAKFEVVSFGTNFEFSSND